MPDICWQGQHDSSFWFAASAGEVSRQLNAIVDLAIIDTTLTNANRNFSRCRTRLEVAEENQATTQEEYEALAWVPGCDAALLNLETLGTDAARCRERADRLREAGRALSAHKIAATVAQGRAAATQAVADAGGATVAPWLATTSSA